MAPRSAAPDAGTITDAVVPEAVRLAGPGMCRVTRELVVPVTGERADLFVVGASTWVFEVKSGRDTLRRLRRQAHAFPRVADRCVLVAASCHIEEAQALLPPWWGLVAVADGPAVTLFWLRAAGPHDGTDRRTLLLMLRRDEAGAALEALDGRVRTGVRRMAMLAELDRRLDQPRLASCVRQALLERPATPGRSAMDIVLDGRPATS